jgi:hypothetical protein
MMDDEWMSVMFGRSIGPSGVDRGWSTFPYDHPFSGVEPGDEGHTFALSHWLCHFGSVSGYEILILYLYVSK